MVLEATSVQEPLSKDLAKINIKQSKSQDQEPSSNWKKLSKQWGIDHKRLKKELTKNRSDPSVLNSPEEIKPNPVSTSAAIQSLFNTPEKSNLEHKVGKYVALDCEFVGIGETGEEHGLARVSIVNFYGVALLDIFVKPRQRITDYRTEITGIDASYLSQAISFDEAQPKVAAVIKDKIVVGHSLKHDFEVLMLPHPRRMVRDTSKFTHFRSITKGRTPSLKRLAGDILGLHSFQSGAHSSVEDAQVAMLLYRTHRKEWESSISRHK